VSNQKAKLAPREHEIYYRIALYVIVFDVSAGKLNNITWRFDCSHQYSKRYAIRKKSDDSCFNPKVKHRIHEGMWQVLYSQLGGF
jgi:CRISPR/Cas system-associated protein Cas10 (large subunit of type III CRISPR-Cas system)